MALPTTRESAKRDCKRTHATLIVVLDFASNKRLWSFVMMAKRPDPLDVMVGVKIRIFRTHRGLSQSDLAEKIGVAFQQVQKYESGANRVGASRLSRIAAALGISIGELFEPSQHKSPNSKSPFHLLAERDALRVLKAFARTTDPRVRRAIARLVESVADQQPKLRLSTARPAPVKRFQRRRTSTTPT
jgi:transcriptional regulator with XRE-family HTH domain